MSDQSETIASRVKAIVADQLDVDEAKVIPEASFIDDLGADSLDTVELVMSLEEAFKEELGGEEGNGDIPEEDAEKLTTVDAVIKYIEDRLKNK